MADGRYQVQARHHVVSAESADDDGDSRYSQDWAALTTWLGKKDLPRVRHLAREDGTVSPHLAVANGRRPPFTGPYPDRVSTEGCPHLPPPLEGVMWSRTLTNRVTVSGAVTVENANGYITCGGARI
ncbi:hypothetical protein GCM10009609_45150 [Pseudonocardia aurantiaca]